jgi:hypothetical protein
MVQGYKHSIIYILALLKNIRSAALISQEVE